MNRRLAHRVMQFLMVVTALGALPPHLAGQTDCGAWRFPAVQSWGGTFSIATQQTVTEPGTFPVVATFNETASANVSFPLGQRDVPCSWLAEGPFDFTGVSGSVNDKTVQTIPPCVLTTTVTGGAGPQISAATLDFTSSTASFTPLAIFLKGATVTGGSSCGGSGTSARDFQIGPVLGAFPSFALPDGGPQSLSVTKTFPDLDTYSIDWTLTLNLKPVLFCQPGRKVSVHYPSVPGVVVEPGKAWDIRYGDLNLDFTTSTAAPNLCKAQAPAAALPVLAGPGAPMVHFADIVGGRQITVHYPGYAPDLCGPDIRSASRSAFIYISRCLLNGDESGSHYYAEWHTDDLDINLLPNISTFYHSGPITLWVDLNTLGLSPEADSMDSIVQGVETFIDSLLEIDGFIRLYVGWDIIQDPGSVSLAVVDSNGLTTGRLPDGRTTADIPGSYYVPSDSNPAVILAPGSADGSLEVLLHGLNTGPYNLAISTGRGASQTPLQNSFSGSINKGANVGYRATINTQMAQQNAAAASIVPLDLNGDGAVNCADTAAVRNAFGTHTGQSGFNAWADVDGSGAIDISDLALVAQQLPSTTVCHGVSPASGSGTSQTMTFTFTDAKGWQDLGVVNILVNSFLDGRHACYLAYSRPADTLFLVDDAGDGGASFAGSAVLHTAAGSMQNSQCAVSWGGSPVAGSGKVLALTLTIGFKPPFAGNKVIYTASRDTADISSGWQAMGVWQVPGGTQTTTTSVAGMSPARGSGLTPAVFTFNFSDSKGYQDLGVVNILVNNFLDGRHACYLAYSGPLDTLFLINDEGDGGGQFAGSAVLHAAAGSLQNSQCTISWGAGTVNADGNNLSLTLTMSFNTGFTGNRLFYLAARDITESNNTGWQAMGSWEVQ